MKRPLSILANEWILVALLVLVGAFFRFSNFRNTMFWSNDVARDMLVSWQISAKDQWPTIGHFNTGIEGYYQPYYFYFLGYLAKFGGTPDFVYACFILLHVMSLVGIYLTAKNLFSRQAGFIALSLSIAAGSLISLSHFPTVAPWSWPLHILSLALTSFWFTTKNRNYLWVAVGVSFVALQIHGSQLLFLVAVMFLIIRQKLNILEYLAWLAIVALTLVNQHALITHMVEPSNSPVLQLHNAVFTQVFKLFVETAFTHVQSFYFFSILLGLFTAWSLWWKRNSLRVPHSGWKYFLAYAVLFEFFVAIQKTGALPHHQYYVIPILLVLVSGWLVHFQLPLNGRAGTVCKAVLLLVFAHAVLIRNFAEVGMYGEFSIARTLFAELKQQNFPVQTATVLVTDNDANRLGDTSNSTQLWWFLATDMARNDFNAAAWSLGNYTEQLIIVCNTKSSAENKISCDAQIAEILVKSQRNFILQRTANLVENFEVKLYQEQSCR
jgi:hypothetical protein